MVVGGKKKSSLVWVACHWPGVKRSTFSLSLCHPQFVVAAAAGMDGGTGGWGFSSEEWRNGYASFCRRSRVGGKEGNSQLRMDTLHQSELRSQGRSIM
jgi:hypothetical protein